MLKRRQLFFAVAIVLLQSRAATLRAAEKPTPTDPQKMVTRLIDAVDAAPEDDETADENERLAKRWDALVRQRTWTDSTGKFKTFASYLSHDPDLKWVELRVLVKGKDGNSFKVVKVPAEKLNNSARDVLKRISVARPQVEDAIKALGASDATVGMEAAVAEGETPAGDAYAGGRDYGGRGAAPAEDPYAQPTADPAEEQPAYVGGARAAADALAGRVAETQGVELPADPSVEPVAAAQPSGDFAPINVPSDAGLPTPSSASSAGAAAAMAGGPIPNNDDRGPAPIEPGMPRVPDPNVPELPDQAAWRTDYEAFRTSLTAEQDAEGNWAPQFGEIQALAKVYALATKPPEETDETGYGGRRGGYGMSPEVQAEAEAALDGAGDMVWEATLKTDPAGPQSPVEFDLAAPSEPFLLAFQCDDARGDFAKFHAGDRVKFIGRFVPTNASMIYSSPGAPIQIWIAVRFPDDQGGASAAAPAAH